MSRCCRQADVKELQDQLQLQQESALKAEKAEQVNAGGTLCVLHRHLQCFTVSYGVQDATAASADLEKQRQSKQQDALDRVSQVKSDLWELWQQVSQEYEPTSYLWQQCCYLGCSLVLQANTHMLAS